MTANLRCPFGLLLAATGLQGQGAPWPFLTIRQTGAAVDERKVARTLLSLLMLAFLGSAFAGPVTVEYPGDSGTSFYYNVEVREYASDEPDGSGNLTPGASVCLRHRALDAIPFRSSLRFDMEVWHWKDCLVDYDTVCWYYLK